MFSTTLNLNGLTLFGSVTYLLHIIIGNLSDDTSSTCLKLAVNTLEQGS